MIKQTKDKLGDLKWSELTHPLNKIGSLNKITTLMNTCLNMGKLIAGICKIIIVMWYLYLGRFQSYTFTTSK